jgi:hypothetical protein
MDEQLNQIPNPIPESNISGNMQTKSTVHRKSFVALILIILLVFLTAALFQLLMHLKILKLDTDKPSVPTPTKINSNTPTTTSVNPFSITIDGFKFPEQASLYPILKDQHIYYLKSGDIWKANLNNNSEITKQMIYKGKGMILDFTISNNEKFLAYSVRKNIYPEMDGASDGDTVIMVNLEDKSEKEIFSQNLEGNQLNGLKFAPDDAKLYFTNTKIYAYDLVKESVETHTSSAKPYSISCFYNPDSFSPTGRYLLLDFGCWEGGKQVVFDTIKNVTVGEFNNGYIGGGVSGLEFLSDATLLGFDNRAPLLLPSNPASDFDYEKQEWKLGAYSTDGSIMKSLGVYKLGYDYKFIIYKDSLSSNDKFYFSLPKSENSKEHLMYEINRTTYDIKPSNLKTNMVLLSIDNAGEVVTYKIQYFLKEKGIILDVDKAHRSSSIFEIH